MKNSSHWVTTGHQKWPKRSSNSIKSPYFAQRAKKPLTVGQSPPQELEVGLWATPGLLIGLSLLAEALPILESYIREEKYRPATATTTAVYVCMSRSGYPPRILKRGGLESSSQILMPANGETKRFCFC